MLRPLDKDVEIRRRARRLPLAFFLALIALWSREFGPLFALNARLEDLALIDAILDPGRYAHDLFLSGLITGPYTLFHRVLIPISRIFGFGTPEQGLPHAYLFGFVVSFLVFAYALLHLSESVFKGKIIRGFFILAVCMNFAPFWLGSNGLMPFVFSPSFVAMPLKIMALSMFLRRDRSRTVFFLVLGLYAHLISGFFLAVAMIALWLPAFWRGRRRKGYWKAWLNLSVKAFLGLMPLMGWIVLAQAGHVQLEEWQLHLARYTEWGHISLERWIVEEPRFTWKSFLEVGRIFLIYPFAHQYFRSRQWAHRSLFQLFTIFILSGVLLSIFGEESQMITTLQVLKGCFNLAQLVMSLLLFLMLDTVAVLPRYAGKPLHRVLLVALFFCSLDAYFRGFKPSGGNITAIAVLIMGIAIPWSVLRMSTSRAPQRLGAATAVLLILFVGYNLNRGITLRTSEPEWSELFSSDKREEKDIQEQFGGYLAIPPDKFNDYLTVYQRPSFYTNYQHQAVLFNPKVAVLQRDLFTFLDIDTRSVSSTGFNAAYTQRWNSLTFDEVNELSEKFNIAGYVFDRRWRLFDQVDSLIAKSNWSLRARTKNMVYIVQEKLPAE